MGEYDKLTGAKMDELRSDGFRRTAKPAQSERWFYTLPINKHVQ